MANRGALGVIGALSFACGCIGAGHGGPITNDEGIGDFIGEDTGDADPTTAAPDDANEDSGTNDDGTAPVTKFDLAPLPDAPNCRPGANADAFSYIWIANSIQGTISKLNTTTLIEEGRYRVRPDSKGSPSRTSVNLSGDVAVASRLGGITKIYARPGDCHEHNGQAGIQTSTGASDILAWGTEECVAWHTPMNVDSQRPVAWDQGEFDDINCKNVDAKIWTASTLGAVITVRRLNGDDGTIEASNSITGTHAGAYGPYGGAVDGHKDFWFMHRDGPPYPLVRVNADSLAYTIWEIPAPVNPYGFAIDPQGRPWIAGYQGGIARFDPTNETWQINTNITGVGMMGDRQGVMWIAHYPWGMEGVSAVDTETMQLLDFIAVPASLGKGVSVDFDGYVWLVDMTKSAFRIDPDTHNYEVYDGLTGPYTYSDMTGFALASVTAPTG